MATDNLTKPMKQGISKIYSSHVYDWLNLYKGHHISDVPVTVQPKFKAFKRFDHAADVWKDDSLVPTKLELISAFVTRQYQKLVNRVPLNNLPEHPIELKNRLTSHTVFRMYVPTEVNIKHQEFAVFLEMLSLQAGTISFEIVATEESLHLHLVCDELQVDTVTSLAASFLPSVIVQKIHTDPLSTFADSDLVELIEFAPRHEFIRPLEFIEHAAADSYISLLSAIENLWHDEQIVLQVLFSISDKPWKESITAVLHNNLGQPFFYQAPEMIQCATQKCLHPQFGIIVRCAVRASAAHRLQKLQESVANAVIQSTASTFNQLQALDSHEADRDKTINDIIQRTTHRKPFVANSHELLSFIHMPGSTVICKKYRNGFTRTKAVPTIFLNHPFVLGNNNHAGVITKVTIGEDVRRRHACCFGASGMGKSSLFVSMIKESLRLGDGIAVIDPHGKLIDDVLQHIPGNRHKDVIVLDPADPQFCFSLNIMSAATEAEKEVLSSAVTAIFRKNAISWGDNVDALVSNSIAAFLYNSNVGTLMDVRRFLLDKKFRNVVLETVTDPQLVYFWQHEFPLLRSNSIGSIMTRLDTFLRPKAIRNMVCQKKGFDFEALLNQSKILLVKLPIGRIGEENAFLLGQLLIAKIYQAAVARQGSDTSKTFIIYCDEFQHFVSDATSINDILTGTRKYGVSLVAASQSISQIKNPLIIDSLLTNAATRICFRLGESDAKKFAEGFSSFTAYDLQNLKIGQTICRIDRPNQDFSLQVLLPVAPICDDQAIEEMISQSRKGYYVPRTTVEQLLLESISDVVSVPEKCKIKEARDAFRLQHSNNMQKGNQDAGGRKETTIKPQMASHSSHRAVQMQVKELAEQFGYTAIIEQQLTDGTGQVDVQLARDGKCIAVEISINTGKKWEVNNNIQKCIAAKYDVIISLTQTERQAQQIKKEFEKKGIQTTSLVYFFTLDTFQAFLQKEQTRTTGNDRVRGYQVNVSFESPHSKP